MFDLRLNEQDRVWLAERYPNLKISDSNSAIISGVLQFDMIYEPLNERIQDQYVIEIEMSPGPTSSLPKVKETATRIPKTADRHINPNDEICCLCSSFLEEKWFPDGFKIDIFFETVLIPYFFGQTYFEKYQKWPWGEYSHGLMGLLESYLEIQGPIDRKILERVIGVLRNQKEWPVCLEYLKKKGYIKGHWGCAHDLGKIFRFCHPIALRGLCKIKHDIQNIGGLSSFDPQIFLHRNKRLLPFTRKNYEFGLTSI